MRRRIFIQGASIVIITGSVLTALIFNSIILAGWSILFSTCTLGIVLGIIDIYRDDGEEFNLPCDTGDVYYVPVYEFETWTTMRVRVTDIIYTKSGRKENMTITTERLGSGKVVSYSLAQFREYFTENRSDAKKVLSDIAMADKNNPKVNL